ncbi:AAA family ATPase [Clostridioides sp. ZZV14-5902]|uniref:AAA family ATPase n=1 Tax=Clostridioides sp. ZZV14-5902 TaxID=2811486 RepID=UPI001D10E2FF|nr:AAA family ATPase [Clostridioides sp. ZZV14-5902]
MKIKTVKIKNFRGYGENKNSEDKFYIFENLDEFDIIIFNGLNGNGKTSFYEAIEWCLTGKVSRLSNILKEVHVNILKKSSHLIFNDSEGKCRDKATVSIEFDNGYKLERSTDSKMISVERKTSTGRYINEEYYNDSLKLICNQEILEGEEAKIRLTKSITDREIDLSGVHKSIALGQETLASFLREYNHKNRESLLMQLFNLDEFYEIENISNSNNFIKLNKVNTNIDNKIKELDGLKKYINSLFESTGYTIDEYICLSDNDYSKLKQAFGKEITYTIKDESIEYKINRINYLKTKSIEINKNISLLNVSNEEVKLLLYIKKIKEINNNLNNIDTIKLLNKEKSQKIKLLSELKINKYKLRESKIKSLRQDLINKQINIRSIKLDDMEIDNAENTIQIIQKEWDYYSLSKSKIIEVEISDIEKSLYEISNEYKIINTRIDNLNKEVKDLTIISDEYNKALNLIKLYVMKNEIDSCPVCKSHNIPCLNDENKSKKSVNDKILDLIDDTVSNNNLSIGKRLDEIKRIEKEKEDIISKFDSNVVNQLKLYKKHIEDFIEFKINRYNKFISKVECYIEKNQILLTESQSIISKAKSLEEELKLPLDKYKTLDEFNRILKIYADNISNTLSNKYRLHTMRDVHIKEQELKNMHSLNSNEFIKNIKENRLKALMYKKMMLSINEYVKKYDLLASDIQTVKKYDDCYKKEIEYKELKDKINNYKEDRQKIYEYFNTKNKELLEKKISQYSELGNYIYKSISPHPFFNQFQFTDMQGGKEVTLLGKENINLSHIFSNAQVNILALSIFLGIGLIDNKIKINQLFIDDPIQSMDDLNILAFIDIIRTITLSKKINKNLIISTHDDNFADLLKIKLRNTKYKEIKFIYYDSEGPIISENINRID